MSYNLAEPVYTADQLRYAALARRATLGSLAAAKELALLHKKMYSK